MDKKPLYRSLYLQIITAIVIGVLPGHLYPQTGAAEPEAGPDPIAQHIPATPAR